MIERARDNPALAADLNKIHDDLKPHMYENIWLWGKAARWAQLYLRKTPKSEQEEQIHQ
jgi:hypothetical protein